MTCHNLNMRRRNKCLAAHAASVTVVAASGLRVGKATRLPVSR